MSTRPLDGPALSRFGLAVTSGGLGVIPLVIPLIEISSWGHTRTWPPFRISETARVCALTSEADTLFDYIRTGRDVSTYQMELQSVTGVTQQSNMRPKTGFRKKISQPTKTVRICMSFSHTARLNTAQRQTG